MTRFAEILLLLVLIFSIPSALPATATDSPTATLTGNASIIREIQIPQESFAFLERKENVIYVRSDLALVAFDAATSKELWRTDRARGGFLYLDEEVVLVQDREGIIHTREPNTGTLRWTLDLGATALGGTVILSSAYIWANLDPADPDTVVLYAIDVNTGTIRWQTDSAGWNGYLMQSGDQLILAEAEVLRAFDAETGREHWKRQLVSPNQPGQMAVDDRTVYFVDRTHPPTEITVDAIDSVTGKTQWSHPLVECSFGTTQVQNAVVYIDCQKDEIDDFGDRFHTYSASTFVAFDARSGLERWRITPSDAPLDATSSPIISNDELIYDQTHHIFSAIDRESGALAWRYSVRSDAFVLSWDVIDENLYLSYSFTNDTGQTRTDALAIDTSTGRLLWHLERDEDWFYFQKLSSARSGRVFGISPSTVVALDATSGKETWQLTLPNNSESSTPTYQFASVVPNSPTYVLTAKGTLYIIADSSNP